MQCFINQSWGGCLSQSLKFHVCSCWSPNTSFHVLHFPYIWQFISHLPVLFPQECYALIFEVTKIHNCVRIKFLAYEWSRSDGTYLIKTFLLLQSCAPQNFSHHRYTFITQVNIANTIQHRLQTPLNRETQSGHPHPLLNWLNNSKTFKAVIQAATQKFS